MTPPAPIQLAAAFTALASRVASGDRIGFARAVITLDGIRIEVTDPAVQNDLITAYDLRRDHSFTGNYTGTVRGVPVSVVAAMEAVPDRHVRSVA